MPGKTVVLTGAMRPHSLGRSDASFNLGGAIIAAQTLPEGVKETHISLFDGSNCGIRLVDRPVFSVQYHPEASPGPQDSYYLFERFRAAIG